MSQLPNIMKRLHRNLRNKYFKNKYKQAGFHCATISINKQSSRIFVYLTVKGVLLNNNNNNSVDESVSSMMITHYETAKRKDFLNKHLVAKGRGVVACSLMLIGMIARYFRPGENSNITAVTRLKFNAIDNIPLGVFSASRLSALTHFAATAPMSKYTFYYAQGSGLIVANLSTLYEQGMLYLRACYIYYLKYRTSFKPYNYVF